MAIPERIVWAIGHLDIGPGERLLEIGCGRGVAMALAAERLVDGHIVGLDRSEGAIGSAKDRNHAAIAAGKASVVLGRLADYATSGVAFDTVFAINVNLFWLEAARELAVIRSLLVPRGRLLLFFEPPGADQISTIQRAVAVRLTKAGYQIDKTVTGPGPRPPLLGIIARPTA
jgi:cyclopropane fatty-acyl-phospholipid synthase-like methyltransferase